MISVFVMVFMTVVAIRFMLLWSSTEWQRKYWEKRYYDLVNELKRYGVLAKDFDPDQSINPRNEAKKR